MSSDNNHINCMACIHFVLGSRPCPFRCRAWNIKSHIYDLAKEVYKSIGEPCPHFCNKTEFNQIQPEEEIKKNKLSKNRIDFLG